MDTAQPRDQSRIGRVALILGLAGGFGIAAAWIKGNDSGLRDAIGNISAVWLLVPFRAGASTGSRRLVTGALSGLAATLAALAGFYFAESFVLDLGPHPWLTDLSLTMRTVVYYGERALVTGPFFGALGSGGSSAARSRPPAFSPPASCWSRLPGGSTACTSAGVPPIRLLAARPCRSPRPRSASRDSPCPAGDAGKEHLRAIRPDPHLTAHPALRTLGW